MLTYFVPVFQVLAIVFWFCGVFADVANLYHFRKFYNAWRRKKVEQYGQPTTFGGRVNLEARLSIENLGSLFSRDLSDEGLYHRKWLLIATAAFSAFCALDIVFLYLGFHWQP